MRLACFIGVLGLALCAAVPSRAADPAPLKGLQDRCFSPQALGAVAGEERARKGDRTFSVPLSRKTPLIAAPAVPETLRGAIRRVELPPGLKLIALTFDFCEDNFEVAGYEGRIIDTLRREHVKATLFLGGKWMRSHDERTRQLMTDPLFEMANHAEAHRNLRALQGESLQDEILGPQRSYELIRAKLSETQCAAQDAAAMQSVAPRISLFRFPFGACNAESLRAVNDAGLLAIQWDVSTGDPSPGTSATAIVRAMKTVKPGSIVIAHANGRGWHTAEALPVAIAELKKQGFSFVTVSELLAAGKPVIAETCYNSRPGDTDRYDHLTKLIAGARKSSWGTIEVNVAPAKSPQTANRKGGAANAAKPARQNP